MNKILFSLPWIESLSEKMQADWKGHFEERIHHLAEIRMDLLQEYFIGIPRSLYPKDETWKLRTFTLNEIREILKIFITTIKQKAFHTYEHPLKNWDSSKEYYEYERLAKLIESLMEDPYLWLQWEVWSSVGQILNWWSFIQKFLLTLSPWKLYKMSKRYVPFIRLLHEKKESFMIS